MIKLYLLTASFVLLLSTQHLKAQCGVTIATHPNTTQLTCKVTSITLTANPSAEGTITYLWSNGATDASVAVKDTGVYWVQITAGVSGGNVCKTADTIHITRNATPKITAVALPDTICSGSNTTLIAFGADNLVWNPGGLKGNIVKVSPDTTTTFTVSGTTAEGCAVNTSVTVVVHPLPMASISGTTTVCQNSAEPRVKFTGSRGRSPYTFAFAVNKGTKQLVTTDSTSSTVTIGVPTNALDTLTYNLLSVTDRYGCTQDQKGTAIITVLPGPVLTSAKTLAVCDTLPFSYTANSSSRETRFSWVRDTVSGIANGRGVGTDSTINEKLDNRTDQPIVVRYVFTLLPSKKDSSCVTTDTVKVVVYPTPALNHIDEKTFCNGETVKGITFSSTSPDSAFTWTNDNRNIGLPENGSGNIPVFVATNTTNATISATIVVSISAGPNGCRGKSQRFTINVLPGPALTSPKLVSVCNDSLFSYRATSSAEKTDFTWKRVATDSVAGNGLDTSNTGSISNRLTNKYSRPATVSYAFKLSTGGACGNKDTVRVTVYPTPVVTAIDNKTFCNGETVKGITFSGNYPEASFTWVNNNANIGLPSSGSDSIPVFTATNRKAVADTALITVSIKAGPGNCPGKDTRTFLIIIRPGPALTSPRTVNLCSGDSLVYTARSSEPATFNWTREAIGSVNGNQSGKGGDSTIREKLTSASTQPVNVTYAFTLFPSGKSGGCAVTQEVTVKVNPTPHLIGIKNVTYCNGTFVKEGISFRSDSPDSSFTWRRKQPGLDIGLPASGTGSILPFNAKDSFDVPITDTVIVGIKASANGCAGPSETFAVTVLPGPALRSTKAEAVCDSTQFLYTAISSAQATAFTWERRLANKITGSGSGSGSGSTINETLYNSDIKPVDVYYVFTLKTGGTCDSKDSVKVVVNPTPKLEVIQSRTYCNDSVVQPINFPALTSETSSTWKSSRSIGFGTDGTGNIPAFIASNGSDSTLITNVTVLPSIGACKGSAKSFTMTVFPTPALTSEKAVSVCNNEPFLYAATSVAKGTKFRWERLKQDSISTSDPATDVSDVITGTLQNPYTQPVAVYYAFALTTGSSCEVKDTIKVTVNPTPQINELHDTTFCNGAFVNGIPFSSASPDSSFTWINDNANIGLPRSGSGSIPGFFATNKTTAADSATIIVFVKASADSCEGESKRFRIKVNPSPIRPSFTSLFNKADSTKLTLCRGSENISFTVNSPLTGVRYTWRTPAPVDTARLLIRDTAQPNTVISFRQQGDYTIQVAAQITSSGCTDTVSQVVKVSRDSSGIAKGRIFLMEPGDLLVYPDNSLKGYQWGYDSIIQVGSSRTFGRPAIFPGQVNQYFVPTEKLDTTRYLYWVQLENGPDCKTRVYYNGPYAAGRIQTFPPAGSAVQVQVIPNPNTGLFRLALKGSIYGRVEAKVYNSLGHVVYSRNFVKTLPEINEGLNAGNLPAGLYVLELRSSDLKKVVSRFVIQR